MIKVEKFTPSGRLYAFALSTLTETGKDRDRYILRSRWTVEALWVRRKNRRTQVAIGRVSLWDQGIWHGWREAPASDDPLVVLAHRWDGRYVRDECPRCMPDLQQCSWGAGGDPGDQPCEAWATGGGHTYSEMCWRHAESARHLTRVGEES